MAASRSISRAERRPLAREAWPALLILALTLLLYSRALGLGFLTSWDDGRYLLENRAVLDPGGLTEIWSTTELPAGFPNYPLTFTTYWIEAQLFGLDPRPFHATNLLLHAVASALCFCMARSLRLGRWGAAAVALLFAVHPVQVESVAWVAERKNVLSAVLFLGAFVCFRRHRAAEGRAWYAVSLALFALACLSKTAAVTLPASLWLADVVLDRRSPGRALVGLSPMLAVALVFGALTITVEHADLATGTAPPGFVEPALRPLLAATSATFYLGKLLWPHPLLPIYPRLDPTLGSALSWLALSGWCLVSVAWVALRRRIDPRIVWGAGHFVATLLPTLGLLWFDFLSRAFVADRFVYLAGLGVWVALAAAAERGVARAARPRSAALLVAGVAGVLFAVLAWTTLAQIDVWRDDVTLWKHTLSGNPRSFDAHVNLAKTLHDRGAARHDDAGLAEAAGHYEQALALRPDEWRILNNLGNLALARGHAADALRRFDQALALQPANAILRANRAQAEGLLRRIDALGPTTH